MQSEFVRKLTRTDSRNRVPDRWSASRSAPVDPGQSGRQTRSEVINRLSFHWAAGGRPFGPLYDKTVFRPERIRSTPRRRRCPWRRGKSYFSPTRQAGLLDGRAAIGKSFATIEDLLARNFCTVRVFLLAPFDYAGFAQSVTRKRWHSGAEGRCALGRVRAEPLSRPRGPRCLCASLDSIENRCVL